MTSPGRCVLVGLCLSHSPEQDLARGFTPERQTSARADMAERFGMPIDLS
jgi:hypothetical protein